MRVPRLVSSDSESQATLLERAEEAISAGQDRLALVGEVGSGKTSEVEHLVRELAQKALTDRTQAIPILLAARSRSPAVGDAGHVSALLCSHYEKIVVVDGADEVGGRVGLLGWLDELADRKDVNLVLVAGRPGSVPPSWPRLDLIDWSPTHRDQLLTLWEANAPEDVAKLRYSPHLDRFTATPLLATYALLVAGEVPDSLDPRRGRTFSTTRDLFLAIAYRLFVEWVAEKDDNQRHEELEAWWMDTMPALAELAWNAQEQGTIERATVSALLNERFGTFRRKGILDRAAGQLGLLVETDGGYRFASRAVSEWLAGEHLVAHPELARKARPITLWAEVRRHGIAKLVAAGQVDQALDWIADLIPRDHRPLQVGRTVRAVLHAVELTTELGDGAAPIATPLAETLFLHLTEEVSSWVGDEVVAVCIDLSRQGGPVWEALLPLVEARAHLNVPHVARWYLQPPDTATVHWNAALFHRDPGTRAEALRRLAAVTSPSDDRTLLLLASVADAGHAAFLPSPMLTGARAIREQLAEHDHPQLISRLTEWLHSQSQRRQIFAAIALPPGHEEKKRAEIFSFSKFVYGTTQEDLEHLTQAHERLDELWPEWRTTGEQHQLQPLQNPSDEPPPSPTARRRLLRVLNSQPTFGHELLESGQRLGYDETEVICSLAAEAPELAIELLNRRAPWPVGLFRGRAMDALAPAVARHQEVRDAVVRMVHHDERRIVHDCPGGALESIVHRDAEARAAYIAWLPRSVSALVSDWQPDRALWELEDIRQGAIAAARRVWSWHIEERGAVTSVGTLLGHWWPAWRDTEIVEHLLSWLDGEDPEKISVAISVFAPGPLPVALTDRFWATVDRVLPFLENQERGFEFLRAVAAISHNPTRRVGLRRTLETCARSRWTEAALAASSALVLHLPQDEAKAVSQEAALRFEASLIGMLDTEVILGRLVRKNPLAWADCAHQRIEEGRLDVATQIAPHLPDSLLLDVLEDAPEWMIFPFWRETGEGRRTARPLDLLERFAWQAGLDSLPIPEAESGGEAEPPHRVDELKQPEPGGQC